MNGNRTNMYRQLAYKLDMDFEEKDEWGLLSQLKDFKLFRKGHSKRIKRILEKKDGMEERTVRIFDYRFVVGGGNSTRIFNQTVFFIESQKLGLPQFWLKPENFFHRIGSYLGIEDIDFEAYPEFSRKNWLKGEDENFIRDSMNKDVLRFFTVEKGWSLEGINFYMIFYKMDKRLSYEQIQDFYKKGMGLYDMFLR